MTTPGARQLLRVIRDTVIAGAALGLLVYEVVWGGARPMVMTILAGLLATPIALRVDEVREGINRRRDLENGTRQVDP